MFWRKKKFVLSKAWPIPILNIVLHVRKCLLLFGMTFSKINVFNSVIVQKICILLKKCNWFSCVWWQPGNVIIIEKFECYILLFKMLKVMYFKIILILIFLKNTPFFYIHIFFLSIHTISCISFGFKENVTLQYYYSAFQCIKLLSLKAYKGTNVLLYVFYVHMILCGDVLI